MNPGSVVLVTGATDGIGKHTAELLLRRAGARVLIHGRNSERVAATAALLGVPTQDTFVADLAGNSAVRQLARDVLARVGDSGVDVLLNNAGHFDGSRSRRRSLAANSDTELTFQVNVVAPFLLTHLLLRHAARPVHVVNVSSISQSDRFADFDDLQFAHTPYSGHAAYAQSKLACTMWTLLAASSAALCEGRGHRFNSLDPGTVNTKMLLSGWGRCGIEIGEADDEFLLVAGAHHAHDNGVYLVGDRPSPTSAFCRDKAAQMRLWRELERLAGLGADERLLLFQENSVR